MSPTKSTSAGTVLSERSTNMSPTKPQSLEGVKMDAVKGSESVRFDPAAQRYQTENTYISPSDAIRSPTTKKLSEIKGKRFM